MGGVGESTANVSFATDFQLGFAAASTAAIYYSQRTLWFNSAFTITPNQFGGPLVPQRVDRVLTQGFTGAGVTYFLRPQTPSLFLTGGLGIAWWAQVFEESTDCIKFPLVFPCLDIVGAGASAGVGYELHQRFSVELTVLWGEPLSDSLSSSGRFDVTSSSTVASVVAQLRIF